MCKPTAGVVFFAFHSTRAAGTCLTALSLCYISPFTDQVLETPGKRQVVKVTLWWTRAWPEKRAGRGFAFCRSRSVASPSLQAGAMTPTPIRIRSIHWNNTAVHGNADCYLQFCAPRLPQGAVSGRVSAAARVRPACAGLSLGRLAPVAPTCLLVATSLL